MFEFLDKSATDSLSNFHASLRNAEEELHKEEHRFASLQAKITEILYSNNYLAGQLREGEERIGALEAECSRVQATNAQRRKEHESLQEHLAALREPRALLASKTNALAAQAAVSQGDYVTQCVTLFQVALDKISPSNGLSALEAKLAKARKQKGEVLLRVQALQEAAASRLKETGDGQPCDVAVGKRNRESNENSSDSVFFVENPADSDAAMHQGDLKAQHNELQRRLEAAQGSMVALRTEHLQRLRGLQQEREKLREMVKAVNRQLEEKRGALDDCQHRLNLLVNDASHVACEQCGSTVWSAESGHE